MASQVLPPLSGKSAFAKRVRGFAKLPGFPILPVIGLAGAMVMAVVGAFGTGELPAVQRYGFWLGLIGWNVIKWQAWFAWRVKRPEDWSRAAALGALIVNLPLPLEIRLALAAIGVSYSPVPGRTWVQALAISAAIFVVMLMVGRRVRAQRRAERAPLIVPDGVLAKAGLRDPGQLLAIEAEDHFCRLHLAGGRSALVHARFGDALAEAARLDGAQVHRGAWVAAAAVRGGVRDGRKWRILLTDGAALAVSSTFVEEARRRGWLNPVL